MHLYRHKLEDMPQDRLAQLVGVTQGQISQYENGSSDVSLAMIYELAKALETTPEEFLLRNLDLPHEQREEISRTLPPTEYRHSSPPSIPGSCRGRLLRVSAVKPNWQNM
jgi:transcriptional regulator with XRE-family HTH domain